MWVLVVILLHFSDPPTPRVSVCGIHYIRVPYYSSEERHMPLKKVPQLFSEALNHLNLETNLLEFSVGRDCGALKGGVKERSIPQPKT